MEQINAYDEVIKDYVESQIPASKDLQKIINRQLFEGEINFLEWVILNNEIISVKTTLLDVKTKRAIAFAQMSYYTAK